MIVILYPHTLTDVIKYNKASGRDKFAEPSSPFWPPTPRVWSQALSSVQRTHPPPPSDLPCGYAFPDPALFVGVKTVDKTFAYLRRWLACCSALIFRFIPHDSNASPLSNDHWCAFLSNSLDQVHDSDWRKAKKISMRDILGTAIQDWENTSDEVQLDMRFRGSPVGLEGSISVAVAQEILWEISELNFRVELSALDHYASGLPSDGCRSLVLQCFPLCPGNLYTVDFDRASLGLVALDVRQQAPYFIRLYDLMKDWKNNEPIGSVLAKEISMCTDSELGDFEVRLAQYYTQIYYEFFGRACTLPCRPH